MCNQVLTRILRLWRGEDGAVTVDWVVLTAAIVSLGALAGGSIWFQTGRISGDIATFIGAQELSTSF
jgi:hypothetical protein